MRYQEIARGVRMRADYLEHAPPRPPDNAAVKATKLHAKQSDAQQDRADAARCYQQRLQSAANAGDPTKAGERKSAAAQAYQRKLQKADRKQNAATAALMRLR